MSRTGNRYDNSVAERLLRSLKQEWTNHERFADLNPPRLSVFKYFETFYNTGRLPRTFEYKTPDGYESEHAPVMAA